jgi:hypothetical protein
MQDHVSGETTYITEGVGGVFGEGILRFDAVDVEIAHGMKRELVIRDDDPLSARYVLTQSYEMGREGWRTLVNTGRADARRPGQFLSVRHADSSAQWRGRGRAHVGRGDRPRSHLKP